MIRFIDGRHLRHIIGGVVGIVAVALCVGCGEKPPSGSATGAATSQPKNGASAVTFGLSSEQNNAMRSSMQNDPQKAGAQARAAGGQKNP